jgi:hypothetical protein
MHLSYSRPCRPEPNSSLILYVSSNEFGRRTSRPGALRAQKRCANRRQRLADPQARSAFTSHGIPPALQTDRSAHTRHDQVVMTNSPPDQGLPAQRMGGYPPECKLIPVHSVIVHRRTPPDRHDRAICQTLTGSRLLPATISAVRRLITTGGQRREPRNTGDLKHTSGEANHESYESREWDP